MLLMTGNTDFPAYIKAQRLHFHLFQRRTCCTRDRSGTNIIIRHQILPLRGNDSPLDDLYDQVDKFTAKINGSRPDCLPGKLLLRLTDIDGRPTLLAANTGYTLLAVYCWGVSLFTFILNLMA